MNSAARWSCLLTESFPIRHWDDGFLIFNPLNASTHLISASAHVVLQTLHEAAVPLALPELAARLADADQVDEDFLAELGACLQQFEDLGLAESLSA